MELFSVPWWSALLAIILIDLVLAGDNAIVIALAARNLPPEHQNKAIIWGTVGAIVVRSAMTVGVVWLLKIPGLMLVGGLGLLWIAYKLITGEGDGHDEGEDRLEEGLHAPSVASRPASGQAPGGVTLARDAAPSGHRCARCPKSRG